MLADLAAFFALISDSLPKPNPGLHWQRLQPLL